jgi:hypothetical protein
VFHDHLTKLLKELNVEGAGALSRDVSSISFDVDGTAVNLTDAPPGLELSATIAETPTDNVEELYTKLLRGNFLGQATKRACIGLDGEAKHIVLSASFPAIRSYREFRDAVEDFVNAVTFWKNEATGTATP